MSFDTGTENKNIFASLSAPLLEAFKEGGIDKPTEIQQKSLLPIIAGKDILGQSMTGSGKTLAFSLPLALRIFEGRGESDSQGVKVLILTPTRELAQQIKSVFHTLLKPLRVRCLEIIGGASYQRQTSALKRGTDVVIGTPGRVADLLRQGAFPAESIETFVLDEVDQMLDFGFFEDLNTIRKSLNSKMQTVFFSATLNKDIEALARTLLKEPVTIKAENVGSPKLIEHGYYFVQNGKKLACLVNFLALENPEQAIIFCETKKDCGEVAAALVLRGLNASSLNSDLSQNERQQTMQRFRTGHTSFLVATNVAARGIDVQELPVVIHYNIPRDTDSYTHRSGRTGRAGSAGNSISIIAPGETRSYVDLMMDLGIKPKELILPGPEKIVDSVTQRQMSELQGLDWEKEQNPEVKASISRFIATIPEAAAKSLLEALLYKKLQNLELFQSKDIMAGRPIHFNRVNKNRRPAYRGSHSQRHHRSYPKRPYQDSRVRSFHRPKNDS